MEMNEFYEAPEVEVLEVNIERGYAGSNDPSKDVEDFKESQDW